MPSILVARQTLCPLITLSRLAPFTAPWVSPRIHAQRRQTRAPSGGTIDHFEHLIEVHVAHLRAIDADELVVDLDVAVGEGRRALLGSALSKISQGLRV
jgi:hypothetical protein